MPLALTKEPGFVTGLAALILADCKADITAENIDAVITASGNKPNAVYSTMFASMIESAGGVNKFCPAPGGGGGGGAAPAAAAAAAPAAAKAPEKPKEEEVDPLAGGMDMFGSSGGGGDY